MQITSKDLSVVVQGAVSPLETALCLKSVRKYLPEAQIILSTWNGSDISHFDGLYDEIVLSDDPGAVIFDIKDKKTNSLNRILVSSREGIKVAKKTYVLRIRTDLILKNNNLLKLYDDFEKRNNEKSLFKQRIFAYDIFSLKFNIYKNKTQPLLFHISDWCYLGLREDIEELFNIPEVEEPEFSQYFKKHKKLRDDIYPSRMWKMSPEQYFTYSNALKVFKDLKFENYLDVNSQNIEISEDFIINNFRVFSPKEWGIYSLKKQYKKTNMEARNLFSYYSYLSQKKDYKKYCDNSINIEDVELFEKLYNIKYFEQLRKHFILINSVSPIKKVTELFSVLLYLSKFLYTLFMEVICKKKK